MYNVFWDLSKLGCQLFFLFKKTCNSVEIIENWKISHVRIQAEEALVSAAIFSILAEITPEQQTQLNTIKSMKALNELPIIKKLLQDFLTHELMKWNNVSAQYTKELRNSSSVDIFNTVSTLSELNQTYSLIRTA